MAQSTDDSPGVLNQKQSGALFGVVGVVGLALLLLSGESGERVVVGSLGAVAMTLIGVGVFFGAIPGWAESMIYGER